VAKFIIPSASVWVNGVQLSGRAQLESAEPKPIPHEVTAAPIEAWRMWYVRRPDAFDMDRQAVDEMAAAFARGENPFAGLLDARLWSVGMDQKWTRTMTARCLLEVQNREHDPAASPARSCGCGIWGLKDESDLWNAMYHYGESPIAYGRVQLWGHWYEHEIGYRAQYARPLWVNVIGGEENVVDELAAHYQCPVASVDPPEPLERLWTQAPLYSTAATVSLTTAAQKYMTAARSASQTAQAFSQFYGSMYVKPAYSQLTTYPRLTTGPEPTHGRPSSFLESSREWTRRYSDVRVRDIAWQPGWFTVHDEFDVTSFNEEMPF